MVKQLGFEVLVRNRGFESLLHYSLTKYLLPHFPHMFNDENKSTTMEYYSAIKRNEIESVLMRWMNLEPIIQSEVSQKGKTNIIY